VVQKFWGNGYHLAIGPQKLQYGVHNFIVIARDTLGMRDAAAVKVVVLDKTPPQLTVPADIIRLVRIPPETLPVKIDLGQAKASDACDPKVMVTNDAPPGGKFPAGKTKVTWTANDLRGNLTTGIQEVTVIPLEAKVMPGVKNVAERLAAALAKSLESAKACKAQPECRVNLQPLIAAMTRLNDLVREQAVQEGKGELGKEISKQLTAGQEALQKAQALVDQSNRVNQLNRSRLRTAAAAQMAQAGSDLQAVINLP